MRFTFRRVSSAALAAVLTVSPAAAREGVLPSPSAEAAVDAWAARTEARMTDDERFDLVHGFQPLPYGPYADPAERAKWPKDVVPGGGYIRGVPRLGVPSLRETDASLGVTNPDNGRPGDSATALPASIALGSTFNPELAYAGAKAVASEARAKGFNVLLGAGMNLARDPRNGRNFEYISEDPLLSGLMAAEAVKGAQSAGVVSTVKHFSLNSNETNRHTWSATIGEAAHRESDLLAFQIAIERGRPGSVMCGYNLVNGEEVCGSDHLLNTVLKRDWGYKGFVMSDWGAVSGPDFAMKGLDQQSGEQLDKQVWFDGPLRAELARGGLTRARLSDMVRRILRSMKASGLVEAAPAPAVDMAAHAATALEIARQGIVLLKNDGALPLAATAKRIAVIGRNVQLGVLAGGGSSEVMPPKGRTATIPLGGQNVMAKWRLEQWMAGAPVDALKAALPDAKVEFDSGPYPQDAAALAARADVAIVFVNKYESERFDSPDLTLPGNQDAIVEATAAANPNTIVVLQTGNPIAMPWRDKVRAIVAAWYPGQEGATAIAEVLSGKVNPSGRLPITFPQGTEQLPRPTIPSYGTPPSTPVTVPMNEGSDVGYRWYAAKGLQPMYAFGHGLGYSGFAYSGFEARGGRTVTARVTVRNTGAREGADVPQLYLLSHGARPMQRLLGFQRVALKPGEARTVTLTADPRLLAGYDESAKVWRIEGGTYRIAIAKAADAPVASREVTLRARTFGK